MSNFKNDNYETKTWVLFGGIFILLMISVSLIPFILIDNIEAGDVMRLCYIDASLILIVLTFIIKKKERIYWMSSFSYEDAKSMNPERRKMISDTIFLIFGSTMTVVVIYMFIAWIIGASIFLDMVVFTTGVIIAVIWMGKSQDRIKGMKM